MKRPRTYIICTGAGAGAQKLIWEVPGCSAYFEGADFPYGTESQDAWFGFTPDRYVNEDAALRFAMAAYQRAWRPGESAVGVGLTAVAAGLREHRGDHRLHMAVVGDEGVWVWAKKLDKAVGALARAGDGAVADREVMYALDAYMRSSLPENWRSLRARGLLLERPIRTAAGTRELLGDPRWKRRFTLFPGAFNPPHVDHFAMAERAGSSGTFAFVISVDHRHKQPLTVQEMLQREKLLKGHNVIFLKEAPLYIDHARRFPESTLVLGSDALERLFDGQWYRDGATTVTSALNEFSYLGTTFLVAARGGVTIDDVFDKYKVDLKYRLMFQELDFVSTGLSSSALRVK